MSEATDSVNPLVWVQFRLQGGWRRLGWICIVCVGGFLVAASAMWKLTGRGNFPAFCGSTLNIVGILLAVLMIIGGSNAVHRAVRKDQSTRMMESHRLSPITGFQALVGYMIGPAVHVLVLYVLGTLVGAYLASVANVPVASWFITVAYLLIAAGMVWSLSLLHALSTSKGGNPILALILIASMGGFAVVSVVPPLAFVLGINIVLFVIGQATGVGGGAAGAPAHLFATLGAELVMTAFWCFAIVRKFRRPDRPPFEVGWGFLFLMVGLLISAGGILLRDALRGSGDHASSGVVVVATMLLMMLVGCVPVYGAEFIRMAGRRNLTPGAPLERPAFVIPATTALIVIASALTVTAWRQVGGTDSTLIQLTPVGWTLVTIIVASWFIGTAGVLRLLQAARYRAVIMPVALWTFALWGIPPFVEQLRRLSVSLASDAEPSWSSLIACSPAGALIAVWTDIRLSVWPGVVFQAAVAVGVFWVGHAMMAKKRRRTLGDLDSEPARSN